MKQKWFYTVTALGVLLMLSGAAVFGWQAYTERKAETAISDLMNKTQALMQQGQAGEEAPPQDAPPDETGGKPVAGILAAPRLGRELPILTKANLDEIEAAPAIYKGELPPSESVLVLYGHAYRSHFAFLSELVVGDELYFTTMDDTQYVYQVKEVRAINPEEVDAVEESSGATTMNLFTCTKDGSKRVLVRCALVEKELQP